MKRSEAMSRLKAHERRILGRKADVMTRRSPHRTLSDRIVQPAERVF